MAFTSIITVHPCSFDSRPCDNPTCRQSYGLKKYFVGNPSFHVHKPIYCEACVRHMFANIPADLIEGGEELEARLREGMEAEYADKLAAMEIQLRESLSASITNDLLIRLAERGIEQTSLERTEDAPQPITLSEPDGAPPIVREPESNATTEPTYRCLDCNEEFESPGELAEHKRDAHTPGAAPKLYVCKHPGCDASFDTPQQLGSHKKKHNEK